MSETILELIRVGIPRTIRAVRILGFENRQLIGIGIIEELAALTKPVEVYIEKMNLFSLDESDKQILEVLKQFMEEEK